MQYKNLKNIKAENQRNRQSERLKNDITRRPLKIVEQPTSNVVFKSFRLSVSLIFSFNVFKVLTFHK